MKSALLLTIAATFSLHFQTQSQNPFSIKRNHLHEHTAVSPCFEKDKYPAHLLNPTDTTQNDEDPLTFLLDSIYSSGWNATSSSWVFQNKGIYTYNTSGNITELINSIWNTDTNHWVKNVKSEWGFDASGNETSYFFINGIWT